MPEKGWYSDNWHSLVIFYPIECKLHKKQKHKWYIVVTKGGDVRSVVAGRWSGEIFLDYDGEIINDVVMWGQFPIHPDYAKGRRW